MMVDDERREEPLLDMPLADAMRTQRAIRRLKPDPVEDELVLRLLELASKAPSGGNRQNAEFLVIRDPAVKRRLARLNRIGWSVYGRVTKLFAGGDEEMLRTLDAVQWQADHYEEIPVIIVACLRWTVYGAIVSGVRPPFPPFLGAIYYGSIFPAVQNLLLAARAAGLGASLTVMPLWSVALAQLALGLPPWVSPVAVIPLGWPRGRYGPTTRLPVGTITHFDHYGHRPYQDRCSDPPVRFVSKPGHDPLLAAQPAARKRTVRKSSNARTRG